VHLLSAALQLTVIIFGFIAVRDHHITIATYLLFQVYILRVIDSLTKMVMTVRFVEGALGDAAEMADLFDRQPAIQDPVKPQPLTLSKGEVQFDHISFHYSEQQGKRQLFKDFDLRIHAGEKIGLVGPSGGGKTTITKLLLRFMDVSHGAIRLDGQDITTITQDDLHQVIGYVPQEPLLFHRSLRENISYGNKDATDEQIIAAAKKAHAHDFIQSLHHGYDTLVGERGIKLSGGQRQRVAIARAMLKNAPILVLDEATSALDSESEKYIQAALWELMENKTTLVIAHRLSTIQHLDRIVVLDEGSIVEQGSHKELLAKHGLYARLWQHQSGGFIDD
jgi:ATP-binding cassette subfamily B protein